MRYACSALARHLRSVCAAFALHLRCTPALARHLRRPSHLRGTCATLALHLRGTCASPARHSQAPGSAQYLRCTCAALALHLRCTPALARHVHTRTINKNNGAANWIEGPRTCAALALHLRCTCAAPLHSRGTHTHNQQEQWCCGCCELDRGPSVRGSCVSVWVSVSDSGVCVYLPHVLCTREALVPTCSALARHLRSAYAPARHLRYACSALAGYLRSA